MIQLNYNQLKKMLRHSTRKTDIFTKHRLKLHISEVKQLLPPPPPYFQCCSSKTSAWSPIVTNFEKGEEGVWKARTL